ncbi:MAG: hypothetical protein PUE22_01990 [Roseburia porci]|nr:hypothetical protein [Roseburia sp.]MDD6742266.1 hypothetical protein [Roseburia porci]
MEQTKTMEQVTSTFTKKIGQTIYKVNVFFAENTIATFEEELKRYEAQKKQLEKRRKE